MPLRECMQKHTHREMLAWMEWLDERERQPDLTHFYLMQIAQEVRRVLSKKPQSIKLEHFRLQFQDRHVPINTEDATAISKARWFGLVGYKRENPDG